MVADGVNANLGTQVCASVIPSECVLTRESHSIMSRGKYNQTYDATYGPRSTAGTPGTRYRVGAACRRVLQDEIAQVQAPDINAVAWMTHAPPIVNTATVTIVSPGVYQYDYGGADLISIPSGVEPNYYASRPEGIHVVGEDVYARVLLIPYVPPPPPPPTSYSVQAAVGSISTSAAGVDIGSAGIYVLVAVCSAVTEVPSGWAIAYAFNDASLPLYIGVYVTDYTHGPAATFQVDVGWVMLSVTLARGVSVSAFVEGAFGEVEVPAVSASEGPGVAVYLTGSAGTGTLSLSGGYPTSGVVLSGPSGGRLIVSWDVVASGVTPSGVTGSSTVGSTLVGGSLWAS